jgi:hypothetical protein
MTKQNIILVLFSNLLCFSCSNNLQHRSELEDIVSTLDTLITQEYNWLKAINSYQNRDEYVDSIYLIGNKLIENQDFNSITFMNNYRKFNKEFGESKYNIDSSFSTSYIIAKIKLLQYCALKQQRDYFYESHYQVDAMGFRVLNNQIKKGKKERIYIVADYFNAQLDYPPIFVINSDTLLFDNYKEQYYYDICDNRDTLSLNIRITTWKWDRYTTINACAPLYLK